MKTDTQLKTARIEARNFGGIIYVHAYGRKGDAIATLVTIQMDGAIHPTPMAKQALEANGYTLPGAKWGEKGEILVQND